MCGTWVEECSSARSSRRSHSARQARPSIGTAVTRAVSDRGLDDGGGLRERGLDVVVGELRVEQEVARGVVVDERRVVRERGVEGGDRGLLLVGHPHALGAVLGRVRGGGDDERDRLADVADAVAREQRQLDGDEVLAAQGGDERVDVLQVARGEHRVDAVEGERLLRVDARDAGAGVGRADEGGVAQPRALEVVDERAVAREVAAVLDGPDGAPDPAAVLVGRVTRHRADRASLQRRRTITAVSLRR